MGADDEGDEKKSRRKSRVSNTDFDDGGAIFGDDGGLGDDVSTKLGNTDEEAGEDESRHRVVLLETRGGGGILSAAEFSTSMWANDAYDDLKPGDENYEAKLRARQVVRLGYPLRTKATLRDLVDSVVDQPETLWARGSWVEYLGNDMKWHLAMIRRVVRQAPDSFDWSDPRNAHREPEWMYFYNVGQATLLPSKYIRANEDGLKHLFGSRPWVWQQYAVLRLEKFIRFQVDHERDFAEVDSVQFADDLYEEWLEDERNSDFRELHDTYSEGVQQMLREHLLSPFVFMDAIVEDEDDWTFDDDDLSIYTYMSVLGSAGAFAICCLFVQLAIPCILLLNALENSERFDAEFTLTNWYVHASWELFCTNHGSNLGKCMNLAVMFIYIINVIPESLTKFYRTAGNSGTAYSRLNSLRTTVWEQNDDTIFQKIGFKLDRYMNTAYVAFLYAVMLFILFNTDEVLDIILNALAAEFIHRIDETIASQEWFDPDQRWIHAAAVELLMQSTLRLRVMESPRSFCKMYNIRHEDYARAVSGSESGPMHSIRNFAQARKDDRNPKYKSPEDQQFFLCAEYARHTGNREAFRQFKKVVTNFSLFDKFTNLLRRQKSGIFHQFTAYRTWSYWDELLFVAIVPTTEEIEDALRSDHGTTFTQSHSDFFFFAKDVALVLTGGAMIKDVSRVIAQGWYLRVPFHFLDSILQIIAFWLQILFPIFILSGFFLVPFCY